MSQSYIYEEKIPAHGVNLNAVLAIPADAEGLVIFCQGTDRKGLGNHEIARHLNQAGIGTLLFDLLTADEWANYSKRSDINLMTIRLIAVTKWVLSRKEYAHLRIGYFGSGIAIAPALKAAAILPEISVIVSRGGRPDLVFDELPALRAPVLLMVGSQDKEVLQINEKAFGLIKCEKRLKQVKGASHLYEDPTALDQAAEIAAEWFRKFMVTKASRRAHAYL